MFRISLKRLLIFSFLIIGLISLGVWIYRSEKQKNAVLYILKNNGTVRYDYQLDRKSNATLKKQPGFVPAFLFRWLGQDYFANVREIEISTNFNHDPLDFSKFSFLQHITRLEVNSYNCINSKEIGKFQQLRIAKFQMQPLFSRKDPKKTNIITNLQNDYSFLKKLKRLKEVQLPFGATYLIPLLKNSPDLEILSTYPMNSMEFEKSFLSPNSFGKLPFPDPPWDRYLNRSKLEKETDSKITSTLASLKKLRVLQLEDYFVRDSTSYRPVLNYEEIIPNLKNLEYLALLSTKPIDLICMKKSKNLHTLILERSKPQNLDALADLPNLKNLNLSNSWLDSLDGLKKVKSLQKLNIAGATLRSIESLGELRNLKYLSIRNIWSQDGNFAPRHTIPMLAIPKNNQVYHFGWIRDLKKLEVLKTTNRKLDLKEFRKNWNGNHSLIVHGDLRCYRIQKK